MTFGPRFPSPRVHWCRGKILDQKTKGRWIDSALLTTFFFCSFLGLSLALSPTALCPSPPFPLPFYWPLLAKKCPLIKPCVYFHIPCVHFMPAVRAHGFLWKVYAFGNWCAHFQSYARARNFFCAYTSTFESACLSLPCAVYFGVCVHFRPAVRILPKIVFRWQPCVCPAFVHCVQ